MGLSITMLYTLVLWWRTALTIDMTAGRRSLATLEFFTPASVPNNPLAICVDWSSSSNVLTDNFRISLAKSISEPGFSKMASPIASPAKTKFPMPIAIGVQTEPHSVCR